MVRAARPGKWATPTWPWSKLQSSFMSLAARIRVSRDWSVDTPLSLLIVKHALWKWNKKKFCLAELTVYTTYFKLNKPTFKSIQVRRATYLAVEAWSAYLRVRVRSAIVSWWPWNQAHKILSRFRKMQGSKDNSIARRLILLTAQNIIM